MKKRTSYLLILSIMMGLGAAWVANNWVGRQLIPDANADANTASVVVASVIIPFGTKIEETHIKRINLPRNAVPEGAILEETGAIGKIAKQQIYTGEALIAEKLTGHDGGSTLAAIIAPNKRAITLRVNDVIGVAGFLLPGNHVDILAAKRNGNTASTETVLQNIKVLAVDQTAATEKNEPVIVRAVTLEMTPAQSETLFAAQQQGPIQLTLRNPNDDAQIEPEPEPEPVIKTEKLAAKPAPRKWQAPTVTRVTVIKGTKVHTEKAKN